jgi:hypothetical protein
MNLGNKVTIMNTINSVNTVNIITRTWTRGISIESDIAIDIWDSGSYKYERWPDGDVCWKVISREVTPTGFSEVLQKMPEWFSPGEVLHWTRVPLLLQGPSQYQLGQWSVSVENQPQAQTQAKPLPQAQAQAKPLPQAQAKPQLQNSEKTGAREGRLQGPQGHRLREGHKGVGVREQALQMKSKELQEKQHQQPVRVLPRVQIKPQTPQGHQQKPLACLINQK